MFLIKNISRNNRLPIWGVNSLILQYIPKQNYLLYSSNTSLLVVRSP